MSDTYSVSYITNAMRGAPVIQGNAPGGLIAVLDCLLINGWGLAAPQSLTVAAGVATATFASATAWEVGAVIEVTGASPAGLNGRWRVATSSGNTMTFATTAADGTYTGTMGIKYADAGWEKVFSGTNKAVYRSADVTGTRFFLRVDDSDQLSSVVAGYETMSDIDTGTGRFPTAGQVAQGGYWAKAQACNAVAIPYVFAADSCMLLHAIAWGVASDTTSTASEIRGFGDTIAVSPTGDAYACVLSCRAVAANQYGESMPGALGGSTSDGSTTTGMCVAPRGWQGLGSAVLQRPLPMTGELGALSGASAYLGAAPSVIDGQIKTSVMALKDHASGSPLRSIIPGVYYIPQSGALALFSNLALADGAGELVGRKLIAVHVGNATYQPAGVALIDLRGPWR